MDGALLVNKHAGVSSFGVIEDLQHAVMRARGVRKRDLPKMGHGGTLDPFATGLLAVCVGQGVKLARYFLGSRKTYEGVIRFGETTVPGDPTEPVSERSETLPASIEQVRELAHRMTLSPYLQLPPMHSAKKKNGKALYELARQGIEIEREAKELRLHSFEILSYEAPRARFRVECSSGTYVRMLAKDLAAALGTVGMLDSLNRVASGPHRLEQAMTVEEIARATAEGRSWESLPAWIPFDRLLDGHRRTEATPEEAQALMRGQQGALPKILARAEPIRPDHEEREAPAAASAGGKALSPPIIIYCGGTLVAVAREEGGIWGLERVFVRDQA